MYVENGKSTRQQQIQMETTNETNSNLKIRTQANNFFFFFEKMLENGILLYAMRTVDDVSTLYTSKWL